MVKSLATRSVPFLLALVVVGWLMVLPSASSLADVSATVRIRVDYVDAEGTRFPLAGVEVWILENYGIQTFKCTDGNGVAVFTDVEPDTLHTAGVGPSFHMPRCANSTFVNPVDGRKMYSVVYKNHRGVLPLEGVVDGFYPVAGQVTRIPMAARDARRQKKVCGGLRTTWVGTSGEDEFRGKSGTDVANALGGADTMVGGGGADYLCGGKGNDVIAGGKAGDVLLGGSGKDKLSGNAGFDIVDGGDGARDWCRGEFLFDCER